MEAILIPVKALSSAKLRLSQRLSPQGRRRLGLAMLADVLRASEKWSYRFILTSDPDAEAVGIAFGCSLIADPGGGLNRALTYGLEIMRNSGVTAALVLPSDVPLVTSIDLNSIFGCPAEVVVARSSDEGTSALLLRPPLVIPPSFGDGSAQRHISSAQAAGVSAVSLDLPSLALDVDVPDDLYELARSADQRESARVARILEATPAQEAGDLSP